MHMIYSSLYSINKGFHSLRKLKMFYLDCNRQWLMDCFRFRFCVNVTLHILKKAPIKQDVFHLHASTWFDSGSVGFQRTTASELQCRLLKPTARLRDGFCFCLKLQLRGLTRGKYNAETLRQVVTSTLPFHYSCLCLGLSHMFLHR